MHSPTPSTETVIDPGKPLRPGDFLWVGLELLDPNPFQPRTFFDPVKLEELAASIVQRGQLQPIAVRSVIPGRYQIVAGGRRTAAFQMLLARAKTESERRKYVAIRATIAAADTDSDMAESAYIENAVRENLNPMEEAVALAKIRELGANLSATEIARRLSQPERRVRRLLRLFDAPEAVKEALTTGVLVDVGEPGESPRRERRHLEMFGALGFMRLFEHHAAKKEATANERTATAIRLALSEGWTVKRIEKHVERTIAGRAAEPETAPPGPATSGPATSGPATTGPEASGPATTGPEARVRNEGGREAPGRSNDTWSNETAPAALFNQTADGFLLRVSRFPQATADQLRAARQALEQVLDALDDQLKVRPEGLEA